MNENRIHENLVIEMSDIHGVVSDIHGVVGRSWVHGYVTSTVYGLLLERCIQLTAYDASDAGSLK